MPFNLEMTLGSGGKEESFIPKLSAASLVNEAVSTGKNRYDSTVHHMTEASPPQVVTANF